MRKELKYEEVIIVDHYYVECEWWHAKWVESQIIGL